VADEWGIEAGYHDAGGTWRTAPPDTVAAFRTAMGAADAPPAPPGDHTARFVREGTNPDVPPGELVLEDGTRCAVGGPLPVDLPLGYHRLETDAGSRPLFVVPHRCYLPASRVWGFAVQLYATRSRDDWGMGDLADLRRLARWARAVGAGTLLLNPLHAVAPTLPQQSSPYSPASRRFRNPLYLRVEEVPGAHLAGHALELAAAEGRARDAGDPIDRDRVWTLQRSALRAAWDAGAGALVREELDAWIAANAASTAWGVWCVLAERHGPDWRRWPSGLRDPRGPEVAAVSTASADAVRFHQWLQWCTERQLAAATAVLPAIQDLPIGVDPGGFDAWTWQDVLAPGVSVGAPPDAFSPEGQNWGLPPFVPHALREAQYAPFVETVRATIAGTGGIRIDHVMGLFRLFWIPEGRPASAGTYVRYPSTDLLDLVCLESVRAGAVVVGEDLGTVEAGVRETLAERSILSYKLLWFEPERPERWPHGAMGAVTTHDLPTVVGLWTGADLEDQARAGRPRDGGEEWGMRDRLAWEAGIPTDAPSDEAVVAAHRLLAAAPCAVVTATLEDLETHPLAARVADVLTDGIRPAPPEARTVAP
jgi:4-alpha-glucanotransferase